MNVRLRLSTEQDRVDVRWRCEATWVNSAGDVHVIGYGESRSEADAICQALRMVIAYLES